MLAIHRFREGPQRATVQARKVYPLPHGRYVSVGGIAAEAYGLGAPVWRIARVWPAFGLEHVDECLHEQRLNRMQLLAAHALDLLDHVLPIDLVVDPLARGEPTQQLRLALGPQQNIIVVEVAHAALGRHFP